MNYEPKFIKDMTIDQINEEIKQLHEDAYRYGRDIPKARIWDLNYTKQVLESASKKKTINDYIEQNDDTDIRITMKDSYDSCDPWCETLWEGNLKDIPEKYRKLKVIGEGYLMGAKKNQLEVLKDDVYGITVCTNGDYPFFCSCLDFEMLKYKKNDYFEEHNIDASELSFVVRYAYNLDILPEQKEYMLSHVDLLEGLWKNIQDQLSADYAEAKYEEAMAAYNMGGYGEDSANAALENDIYRYKTILDHYYNQNNVDPVAPKKGKSL